MFGLVAFVILSAIFDSSVPTLLIINTDESGRELSCVLVDCESATASAKTADADRKITLKVSEVQTLCEACGVEYKSVSESVNAVYLTNKIADRLRQDDGNELFSSLIADLNTDLTEADFEKWKKSTGK